MDPMIASAAYALSRGNPLGALKRIALRDDAPAMALRGIAMAQLGDFERAKALIRAAARRFGTKEKVARARCVVAEAEIALASRDLSWPVKTLSQARTTLYEHGDRVNAAHAGYIEIRRQLLVGQIDEAERSINSLNPQDLPPVLRGIHALIVASIAIRRLHIRSACQSLKTAQNETTAAGIPALTAEVESAWEIIKSPAARLIVRNQEKEILLEDVETLFESNTLVMDVCRSGVRRKNISISLAKRPVLFALSYALGQAWPDDISRNDLIAKGFQSRFVDASHRARLRVEISRLRTVLEEVADIQATKSGFKLTPKNADTVAILTYPTEEEHTEILALLSDGESWSSSALALAVGISQRTVQRSLDSLAETGRVQSIGKGRSRRWITRPLPGFTTTLLLTVPLPTQVK